MAGQGCAARGHGYGPRVVCRVRHVVPSQVVPKGVGEWPGEARVAGGGGGAPGAAGRARWRGLRSPQWGQWVRRCTAPRQTQWSRLQGRAVCGSRWRTQRGHRWLAVGGTCGRAVAWGNGGWRRAHAGGRVCGALGARACRASVVRGGWCVGVVGVPCWAVCHGVGSHGW